MKLQRCGQPLLIGSKFHWKIGSLRGKKESVTWGYFPDQKFVGKIDVDRMKTILSLAFRFRPSNVCELGEVRKWWCCSILTQLLFCSLLARHFFDPKNSSMKPKPVLGNINKVDNVNNARLSLYLIRMFVCSVVEMYRLYLFKLASPRWICDNSIDRITRE